MAPPNSQLASRPKIDVLIPAIEKDLRTLPFVVSGVLKNVKHPIGEIIIVAPRNKKIMALCHRKKWKFVDENSVLPITKNDIHYRTKRWNRSNWLFQQLLKLNGDKLCSQNFFLVIDADTVLIRPHIFRINQKTVFYCRNWSHKEYFTAYKKLLGKQATSPLSFVTHYMLFEKSKLKRLKQAIASRHHTSWYSAIIKSVNKSSNFGFSEFETYGNFVRSHYPGQFIFRRALNKGLQTNASALSGLRMQQLSKKYRSLSFHKRRFYLIKK